MKTNKLLNRNTIAALSKFLAICTGMERWFAFRTYFILILEVLTVGVFKEFIKSLSIATNRILGVNCEPEHLSNSEAYLLIKLAERAFKKYPNSTVANKLLKYLQFDLAVNVKYQMAESFPDFVKKKEEPFFREILQLCNKFEMYSRFVVLRNEQFRLTRNMLKATEMETILKNLCSDKPESILTSFARISSKNIYLLLTGNDNTLMNDDFADLYVEVLVNEIDFWSDIFEANIVQILNESIDFDSYKGFNKIRAIKDFFINDLMIIEAEGNRALANGDEARAKKIFQYFIQASDRYRAATNIKRSYKYSEIKKIVKVLESET